MNKVVKQTGKRKKSKIVEPFFKDDAICILHDDLLKTRQIAENSVDLTVTSPPYNLDMAYGRHNDGASYENYLKWTRDWLEKVYRLTKEDGRFCLNVPLDKNKNGQQSVCADMTTLAKSVGWKYHSTIIWNEGNISRRTAWGSWKSASAPYVIAPVEVILVLYKNSWKKLNKGVSDVGRDEFMNWTNGLWTFKGESAKRVKHPAPFPKELPSRCIKMFSYVGDVVLDPFLGSGTTLIACAELKRNGIGVDLDLEYCKIAKERLFRELEWNQMKLKV